MSTSGHTEGRPVSRIALAKSIVVACDIASKDDLERLVVATQGVPQLGGYKVGFSLALKHGLPEVVRAIRKHTGKPIIYDHQKGGTDVPHTGAGFARVMAEFGVDYAILFPFASPSTEEAWITALQKEGVIPIVGAFMTIPDFAAEKGGYIGAESIRRIFELACSMGVTDFVLPGNNPGEASRLRQLIEARARQPSFFLPGLGAQGGDISSCGRVMGDRWHAIVGRSIYGAQDPGAAASALGREI
jgi:orotidine-5'-phosphate decarboxylase